MGEQIIVQTGEVKVGLENDILKSSPIGSCVVVVFFDEKIVAGGMAHIMLPGKAPEKKGAIPTRYTENAIEDLLNGVIELGARKNYIKAVIAGGGNVLKREGDMIGTDNLNSVSSLLKEKNIPILAQSVGGTNRKSVRFDIRHRIIYFTEGDSIEGILLDFSHSAQ